jgi:hypothetical protein
MNKALVEIFVPAAQKSFDIYIPLCGRLYETLSLLNKAISELTAGEFMASPETALCDRETGNILDINSSVAKLNLQNGSRLMLI